MNVWFVEKEQQVDGAFASLALPCDATSFTRDLCGVPAVGNGWTRMCCLIAIMTVGTDFLQNQTSPFPGRTGSAVILTLNMRRSQKKQTNGPLWRQVTKRSINRSVGCIFPQTRRQLPPEERGKCCVNCWIVRQIDGIKASRNKENNAINAQVNIWRDQNFGYFHDTRRPTIWFHWLTYGQLCRNGTQPTGEPDLIEAKLREVER